MEHAGLAFAVATSKESFLLHGSHWSKKGSYKVLTLMSLGAYEQMKSKCDACRSPNGRVSWVSFHETKSAIVLVLLSHVRLCDWKPGTCHLLSRPTPSRSRWLVIPRVEAIQPDAESSLRIGHTCRLHGDAEQMMDFWSQMRMISKCIPKVPHVHPSEHLT